MFVYKLIENETTVYVGITKDIVGRIETHAKTKAFDKYEYVCVDTRYDAVRIEAYLIHKINPTQNNRLIKDYVKAGEALFFASEPAWVTHTNNNCSKERFEGEVIIPQWLLSARYIRKAGETKTTEITLAHKVVYSMLLCIYAKDSAVYMRQDDIAKHLGLSRKTVVCATNFLEEYGLVVKVKSKIQGAASKNGYIVNGYDTSVFLLSIGEFD